MLRRLEEFIRNFLVWIYILITVPVYGSLAILTRKHFWARIWCKGLLKVLGIKIKVFKKAELPQTTYVFMANHQSQLDIPVLEKVLESYKIRFLAKKSLFKIPFFGWGLSALGYIPVERENPKEGLKSALACVEKLKEGFSLVIFPEGTRSATGELLPFKIGGFLIPLKSRVKVVPVSILGTREILPKGSCWFKLSKSKEVKVYIGEPIDTKEFSIKDRQKLSQIVREDIIKGLQKLSNFQEEKA